MSIIFNRLRISQRSITQRNVNLVRRRFHGLPGIPEDTVVRLTSRTLSSEVYLVGTCHMSEESAETVRKVINLVKPDIVAVELCRRRAIAFMNWKFEDDLYKIFLSSMKVSGGICMKIGTLLIKLYYRHMRAKGIFPSKEFKVAMEESVRLKTKFFVIDEDINVLFLKLSHVLSFDLIKSLFKSSDQLGRIEQLYSDPNINFNRANVRTLTDIYRNIAPELVKVLITERDRLMYKRLRGMSGKVVAVVGLAHMDGIELRWRLAEELDSVSAPLSNGAGLSG